MGRVKVHGGTGARFQAAAVGLLARAARPVGHRGVQRLTWMLGRHFATDNHVTLRIGDGSRLRVYLDDGYWVKLLDPAFVYEPEIREMLGRVLTSEAVFLDCGANIGYWSVLARHRARCVVAVEASPETFRRLTDNIALNDGDVEVVHAALWEQDEATLSIVGHHLAHAAASVCERNGDLGRDGWQAFSVPSVTVDTLLQRHCAGPAGPVVVKLDVEGAEIPAVKGAANALRERDVIFLFEDHGNDPTCKVSRHFMEMGLVVMSPGRRSPLTIREIAAVKTDPTRGYNFAACRPDAPFVESLARPWHQARP
ncbi:FkbM family methyltransferase [Streptomyces glomeratus]|nr:FkbM family methyltransferase [Streptomyces glomeratus]MCF1506629.1 FkbM family methyltransferase [Streptomyces glomeratus]